MLDMSECSFLAAFEDFLHEMIEQIWDPISLNRRCPSRGRGVMCKNTLTSRIRSTRGS